MLKQTNQQQKKDNKKKAALLIIFILGAFLFTIGVVAAFYSDLFTSSLGVKTGTLKIDASYSYYLNGSTTPVAEINNLNPGDVVVVKGTVSNVGNKSAWIRDYISLGTTDVIVLPFIEVYKGELTQADFVAPYDFSSVAVTFNQDGVATSDVMVINGSGTGAEIEDDDEFDYDYLNSSTYNITFTIYFSHLADNTTQGKLFNITMGTQALQFRNNNLQEPLEAAWLGVSAAPQLP